MTRTSRHPDLPLAGRGTPVPAVVEPLVELSAWVAHRRRRVAVRSATKNQLLGQLDRAFAGLTSALPDVLGTRVGRLVAAEFTDPADWLVWEWADSAPLLAAAASGCLPLSPNG